MQGQYPTKSGKWSRLGEAALNVQRQYSAQAMAKRKTVPWTQEEVDLIHKMKPRWKEIQALMPTRSLTRIRAIGYERDMPRKTGQRSWTAAERSLLKKLIDEGKTPRQCMPYFPWIIAPLYLREYAKHHGFKWKRKLARTGVPVVDQIRDRCLELGYSLVDLDEWCKSGRYFQHNVLHQKYINHQFVERALKILGGGKLVVQWETSK